MVEPQVTQFWQKAVQSGLIDAKALKACWEKIPPAKRTPDAADRRLARQAVEAGFLTLWQAQQIVNGRSSGFKIDKYILLDRIGTGGMGRVYLARDTRLGRRVAVKILSPERLNNPRALARFLREAKVGAQLQHENLVRVYDEGDALGAPYLVMELIEGKTVAKLISDNGPLPSAVAAGLTRQVALGLEHAYQKGLIHRDVNPMNIMVTRDGVAKLTDLGLALDTTEDAGNVTRDGVTVGTFDYISPEQARHSRNVDTRTDIYSLGCTLYHMIAGQVPFPLPSLPEKLYAHQVVEPEPLSKLVPGVPSGLEDVVQRMMRKSPEDRYPTPLAVAMALEPFQGGRLLVDQFEAPAGSAPLVPIPDVQSMSPPPAPDPKINPDPGSDPDLAIAATPPPDLPEPIQNGVEARPYCDPPRKVEVGGPSGAVASALPEPSSSPVRVAFEKDVVVLEDEGSEIANENEADAIEIEDDETTSDVFPIARPALPEATAPMSSVAEEDAIEIEDDEPPSDRFPIARTTPPASGDELVDASSSEPDFSGPAAIIESLREPPAKGGPVRLLLNAVTGILIVALAAAFLSRTFTGKETVKKRPPLNDDGRGPGLEMPRGASIVVRLPDGTKSEEPDLRSALARVASGGGEIAIAGPKLITADTPVELAGRVVIKPAAKSTAMLMVEIAGAGPFLRSRAGGSLTLEGLTFAITLKGKPSTVVVEAAGDLAVRRCLFMAGGKGDDARAIVVQGASTMIEGCGFRGFDRPVDLALATGATATLTNCLFAWSKAGDHKTGWAVRARPAGGGAPKGLTLDHCTIAGGGLIEVAAGFSAAAPLPVQVQNTAVLSDAMVLWGPSPKEFPKAVPWQGKGNRYDIQKAVWVVLPPSGFDGLPGGPNDPVSWEKAMPESGTTVKSFRFVEDGSISSFLQPQDYALADKDVAGIGADTKRVGPPGR